MLRAQWPDAPFGLASLNDRLPVGAADELVVVAAPDPQGLEGVRRLAGGLDPAAQALVVFNARFTSGDVGVGLNARRLRDSFLATFATTYSLRPIGDVGSVFRRYPGPWQVFVADAAAPGRYRLAAETRARPGGEDLDLILMEALGGGGGEGGEGEGGGGPGLVQRVGLAISGLQRFARSLSR
jgi:hypothetical protein